MTAHGAGTAPPARRTCGTSPTRSTGGAPPRRRAGSVPRTGWTRVALPGRRADGDAGSATIEFIFVGLLVLVPLLYLGVAVFEVQRNTFAVTQAAREAGRAFATADDVSTGEARARYAVTLALTDQGLDATDTDVRFGPVGSGCRGGAATLDPGADFEICVVRHFRVPGVPTILDGGNNTATGRYVVHVDDFRSVR